MSRSTKKVVILIYDGVQTLDATAPLDAFASANAHRHEAYDILVAGLDGGTIKSETGLRLMPDTRLDEIEDIDTLMIPGGMGLRVPGMAEAVAAAILAQANKTRRIVSICTGIYGLAPTGLLDGLQATTHWKFAVDVAARFPNIRIEPDALFIEQGHIYTAAGVTAGIDLTLALIEADYGAGLAVAVARDLVVYVRRSGGQQQYSEPLRFQTQAIGHFDGLGDWIAANLHQRLSVESLAARVNLSSRQFSRRFAEAFGTTPAQHIEMLRLDAARARLGETSAPIEQIAHAVGFASADAFTRAFARKFGVPPTEYRCRFSTCRGNEDA